MLAERTAEGQRIPPPSQPQAEDEQPTRPHYAAPIASPAKKQSVLERWKSKGGVLGGIASALLVLAKVGAPIISLLVKFKFLLIGAKFLLAGGSALLSMWVWAKVYGGWPVGIGIVLLIAIHECGHALAARWRGIPTGIMVFIPLFGAFVTTKRYGKNIVEDAFIGIMGPVFGTLAGLGCLLIYALSPSHSPFWLGLAALDFFINLFNLAPTAPLDGGWITPLFSPKALAFGVIVLVFVGFRNPLIWVLGVMSLPRIISGWKAKPDENPYYQATTADRWKFGAAYLGLAAFLAVGQMLLGQFLHTLHSLHPLM